MHRGSLQPARVNALLWGVATYIIQLVSDFLVAKCL